MTNKMQLCRIIYYSLAALHVSSDIFAHNQVHLYCITASVLHTYVAASWYHGSVGTPMIPDGSDITCVIPEGVIQFKCS